MEPEGGAQLAEALHRYLMAHPDAADTAAGIQRWWLNDVANKISPRELRVALEILIAKRVVTKKTLPDGTEVYTPRSKP